MPLPDVLSKLLTAAGPSGYETAPAAVFAQAGRAFTDDVSVDIMGSAVARVAGTAEGAPSLAIVGHIDEIGLIVTHIDDKGFLRFIGVGGWDPQILVGQRVELITRDGPVPGVFGRKPIHMLREEERKKVVELRDIHIDIGAKDGDEARELVRIGDVAVIAGEPLELRNDRVRLALDGQPPRRLHRARGRPPRGRGRRRAGRRRGLRRRAGGDHLRRRAHDGLRSSARRRDRRRRHARDGLAGRRRQRARQARVRHGPIIERGSVLNPVVFELLHDAAKREDIPFTIQASARSTGTDADAIHLARAGIPTGGVSIALRYMHSPVEMVQLGDIDACARLIAAFAQSLSAETTFAR